ncbi:MAG: aldo/keto reductase [Prevotella sp.]|nr:aldo/keto reductase [Prevotella sp.]
MRQLPWIFMGTFQNRDYDLLLENVREGLHCNVMGYDTAPSYKSEKSLGKALKTLISEEVVKREDLFVSDKIDAWQMQEGNGDVRVYIKEALREMQLSYFDLILIHWPIADYLFPTLKCLLGMKEEGIIRNLGVCNVRLGHLKRIHSNIGILPDFIQNEIHPLNTCDEVVDWCNENHVSMMAYSPLCRMNVKISESLLLKELSAKYNRSIGQIILRWHLERGVIPVFMTHKPKRIAENTAIRDFTLDKNDVERISMMNENYKIFLESNGCPAYEIH